MPLPLAPTSNRSPASPADSPELTEARFAMRLSLAVGLLMLIGKTTAYLVTHSAAIFSDAAESVVHVVAVAFASFSLRLSAKPAQAKFHYGYERIIFFSAGFEGAMIILAAVAILIAAIHKWLAGLYLENLGIGTLVVLAAGAVNAGLGYYLLRVGRRTKLLILEADGKHVLTDSWTSFGVVIGLGLVLLTHWKPFDPLAAIAVAFTILLSGGRLMWRSAVGLLDYSDPDAGRLIRERLDAVCSELDIHYHGMRFRTTGYRQIIEVHLLFPHLTPVGEAHRLATILEARLATELSMPAEVITHLESLDDHGCVQREEHYTGKPDSSRVRPTTVIADPSRCTRDNHGVGAWMRAGAPAQMQSHAGTPARGGNWCGGKKEGWRAEEGSFPSEGCAVECGHDEFSGRPQLRDILFGHTTDVTILKCAGACPFDHFSDGLLLSCGHTACHCQELIAELVESGSCR